MPPKAIADMRAKLLARRRARSSVEDSRKASELLASIPLALRMNSGAEESVTISTPDRSNDSDDELGESETPEPRTPNDSYSADDAPTELGRKINDIGALKLVNAAEETTVLDALGHGMVVVVLLRQFG